MISLETARKLRDAGLVWEPETCDTYYWPRKFNNPVQVMHRDFDLLQKEQDTKGIVWAPRLDQLLAEIERRECWYSLARESGGDNYSLMLWKAHCGIEIFYAATAAQAAVQALLWILGREGACNAVHV